MVTSNPSPGYISRVSKAFISGMSNGIGTGKRGDLGATFAAVLLDQEARSTVLDGARSFGQMREPLLKHLALLRATGFAPRGGGEFSIDGLVSRIGQDFFMQPTGERLLTPQITGPCCF